MVLRIESGRPVAHVAAEMGISRPTAYKWWNRWNELGELGLVDRSSRPHSCSHETPPAVVAQIEELRRTLKLGPAASATAWGWRPRRSTGYWSARASTACPGWTAQRDW